MDQVLTIRLEDLGFSRGIIAEIILTTYNAGGQPNAAPMGVNLQDGQHFNVDLFNTSQTLQNIKANQSAVINIVKDIEMFYRSAFKEANPDGKLPPEWFSKAQCVNAPKLQFADAIIEVSVEHMELNASKTRAVLKVELIKSVNKYPQAFNRAFSLTLEAIINATRIITFLDDPKQQQQVAKLSEVIFEYRQIINRVSPNSVYSAVMDDLTSRIEKWKNPNTV
jgi:hypothetical protein